MFWGCIPAFCLCLSGLPFNLFVASLSLRIAVQLFGCPLHRCPRLGWAGVPGLGYVCRPSACSKPTGYGHTTTTCPKPSLTAFRTYGMIRTSISYIGCVMRVFAYCRVSTTDQSTENQVLEIASAGFALNERRIVKETISGSVPADQRPGPC